MNCMRDIFVNMKHEMGANGVGGQFDVVRVDLVGEEA